MLIQMDRPHRLEMLMLLMFPPSINSWVDLVQTVFDSFREAIVDNLVCPSADTGRAVPGVALFPSVPSFGIHQAIELVCKPGPA